MFVCVSDIYSCFLLLFSGIILCGSSFILILIILLVLCVVFALKRFTMMINLTKKNVCKYKIRDSFSLLWCRPELSDIFFFFNACKDILICNMDVRSGNNQNFMCFGFMLDCFIRHKVFFDLSLCTSFVWFCVECNLVVSPKKICMQLKIRSLVNGLVPDDRC